MTQWPFKLTLSSSFADISIFRNRPAIHESGINKLKNFREKSRKFPRPIRNIGTSLLLVQKDSFDL